MRTAFSSPVLLEVLNLPSGYVASGTGFNPGPTVTPPANGSVTSTLTIATNGSTATGLTSMTLRLSSSGYPTQTGALSLTVNPAATGSFTATITPSSEEHTSELQSHLNLVCPLLLDKKKPPPPNVPTLPSCHAPS